MRLKMLKRHFFAFFLVFLIFKFCNYELVLLIFTDLKFVVDVLITVICCCHLFESVANDF